MLAHRCQSSRSRAGRPGVRESGAAPTTKVQRYFREGEGGGQTYLGGESHPGAHTARGRAACQETGCSAATEYEHQSGPRDDCEHLGRRSRRPRATHRDGGGQLDHHGVSEPSGDAERPGLLERSVEELLCSCCFLLHLACSRPDLQHEACGAPEPALPVQGALFVVPGLCTGYPSCRSMREEVPCGQAYCRLLRWRSLVAHLALPVRPSVCLTVGACFRRDAQPPPLEGCPARVCSSHSACSYPCEVEHCPTAGLLSNDISICEAGRRATLQCCPASFSSSHSVCSSPCEVEHCPTAGFLSDDISTCAAGRHATQPLPAEGCPASLCSSHSACSSPCEVEHCPTAGLLSHDISICEAGRSATLQCCPASLSSSHSACSSPYEVEHCPTAGFLSHNISTCAAGRHATQPIPAEGCPASLGSSHSACSSLCEVEHCPTTGLLSDDISICGAGRRATLQCCPASLSSSHSACSSPCEVEHCPTAGFLPDDISTCAAGRHATQPLPAEGCPASLCSSHSACSSPCEVEHCLLAFSQTTFQSVRLTVVLHSSAAQPASLHLILPAAPHMRLSTVPPLAFSQMTFQPVRLAVMLHSRYQLRAAQQAFVHLILPAAPHVRLSTVPPLAFSQMTFQSVRLAVVLHFSAAQQVVFRLILLRPSTVPPLAFSQMTFQPVRLAVMLHSRYQLRAAQQASVHLILPAAPHVRLSTVPPLAFSQMTSQSCEVGRRATLQCCPASLSSSHSACSSPYEVEHCPTAGFLPDDISTCAAGRHATQSLPAEGCPASLGSSHSACSSPCELEDCPTAGLLSDEISICEAGRSATLQCCPASLSSSHSACSSPYEVEHCPTIVTSAEAFLMWVVGHLEVFCRSLCLLQLLAFLRVLLCAIPLSRAAHRTNRRIMVARLSLRGAPLALVLAFCCVVVHAAPTPGGADAHAPSLMPLDATVAAAVARQSGPPDDVSHEGPAVCTQSAVDDPSLSGTGLRVRYVAVQVLRMQSLPTFLSLRWSEVRQAAVLVDLAEEATDAKGRGVQLVEVFPQPCSDTAVLLSVPTPCLKAGRCPVCIQCHVRDEMPHFWQEIVDNTVGLAEIRELAGQDWSPQAQVYFSDSMRPLSPEESRPVSPGCLIRIVHKAYNVSKPRTLDIKLLQPEDNLRDPWEVGFPPDTYESHLYALLQLLEPTRRVQYSPIPNCHDLLDEVLVSHAASHWRPYDLCWPRDRVTDLLVRGRHTTLAAGAFPQSLTERVPLFVDGRHVGLPLRLYAAPQGHMPLHELLDMIGLFEPHADRLDIGGTALVRPWNNVLGSTRGEKVRLPRMMPISLAVTRPCSRRSGGCLSCSCRIRPRRSTMHCGWPGTSQPPPG